MLIGGRKAKWCCPIFTRAGAKDCTDSRQIAAKKIGVARQTAGKKRVLCFPIG